MKNTTYKIVLLFVVFVFCNDAKSQFFVESSLGISPIEDNAFGRSPKMGKQIQLQIGRFVNERKMRSFSVAFRNSTLLEEVFDNTLNGVRVVTDRAITTSRIAIGYERKVTFANTEFDDIWQFYNILNYRITFVTVKDEVSNPQAKALESYNTSIVTPYISAGLGMARKFTQNGYIYADLRFYGPLIELNLQTGAGFKTNFGVRYFF